MEKLIYLTTNKFKMEEANLFFKSKYGFDLKIMDPSFEIPEIQAKNCADVVKFSVKYAAEKLGYPVLKSDSGLYIECLGGLPGPYNAYFDKQIGVEKFLKLIKDEENRNARLEHTYGYCAPGEEPIVFSGGSFGTISYESKGNPELGRWHDMFFIPEGENRTLCEIREQDPEYEASFYGTAADDFAKWYIEKSNNKALKIGGKK